MDIKKILSVGLGLIVVGIAAVIAYNQPKNSRLPSPTPPITQTPSTENRTKTYTATDIASHNNASSCWTIVNGNVYDLTNWISSHPGGEQAILGLCGKDGTEAFMNQHGGQSRPERVLASFNIGTLTK